LGGAASPSDLELELKPPAPGRHHRHLGSKRSSAGPERRLVGAGPLVVVVRLEE